MQQKTKLRPVRDGEWWLLGPSPDLSELLPGQGVQVHECVDHHVYQSADGAWHLWGCIRKTPVGRILYHWEGECLTEGPWRPTGEIIRADREAGESLEDWRGEEWIQSPFVVREGDIYYMFYGGHGTGVDADGRAVPYEDPRTACQICLMTSPDGRRWTRHRNRDGQSRLFLGPGEARDPCLIKVGDLWHLYYAGYADGDRLETGFFCRTSSDLICWSGWRMVHSDPRYGPGPWGAECPHVVYRQGYYYLFRTEHYATAKTHVFCSADPFDFGIGDAGRQYVGPIAVAAPEIIVDSRGNEYITSNHDLRAGTRLCRLRWVRV
jgi:hypothetical protein